MTMLERWHEAMRFIMGDPDPEPRSLADIDADLRAALAAARRVDALLDERHAMGSAR